MMACAAKVRRCDKDLIVPLANKNPVHCEFSNVGPHSSFVSLTPSVIRFPYNDPQYHSQRLTIWNRTMNAMRCLIKSPNPERFLIYWEGKHSAPIQRLILYGLAAKTIMIKFVPGLSKIGKDELELSIHTFYDETATVMIPLQIFPSNAWFVLQRTIVIPDVILGRKADASITLPQPPTYHKFFVTFHPSAHESIQVTPTHGIIGGGDGIEQLKVTYTPTEFTTVCCLIQIHFPTLSHGSPHEITIVGRSRPGREAEIIQKEIKEIETFRPKPTKQKKRYPRMVMRKLITPTAKDFHVKSTKNLFSHAGVMHFLLRNKDEFYKREAERKTAVEVLVTKVDLTPEEKSALYENIRKKLDVENVPTDRRSIKKRQTHWEEFQQVVGESLGQIEEFSQGKSRPSSMKRQTQASTKSPEAGANVNTPTSHSTEAKDLEEQIKQQNRQRISEEEEKIFNNQLSTSLQLDFTPRQKFIQAGRAIILRVRADKRLALLRVLINKMRKPGSTASSAKKGSTGKGSSKHSKQLSEVKSSVEVLYQNKGEPRKTDAPGVGLGNQNRKSSKQEESKSDGHGDKESRKTATVRERPSAAAAAGYLQTNKERHSLPKSEGRTSKKAEEAPS